MVNNKTGTLHEVKNILIEITHREADIQNAASSAHILKDLGLDSLQLISFILAVEERMEVEFDFDQFDYDQLSSLDTFCSFLDTQKHLNR